MSESPERPRLTRRQLREMEQARLAAESEQPAAEADSPAGQPSSDFAMPAPSDFSTPAPSRPTMTRRQMREAAQREAEEARRAQEQQAAQSPQTSGVNQDVQIDFEEEAAQQAQPAQPAQPSRPAQQQWRAQDAPPPALETEDAPRVPEDRGAAQRALAEQTTQSSQEPQREPQRASIFGDRTQTRPGFYPAPQNLGHPANAGQAPVEPTPDFSAAPNVRPPEGITAIRTIEETGELSPILHTSPGENVWPSIPGSGEDGRGQKTPEVQQQTVPTSTPVPFRAPAWGARTMAAEEAETQAAAGDVASAPGAGFASSQFEEDEEPEAISGMSAAPSRWPAGGGLAGGASGVKSPSSGGFPSIQSLSESSADTDFGDEDDEEYEPMFTWLRLLVLMIIAFVLGALVWLIIGKSDAGAVTAALGAVIGLKNPLGE